MEAKEFQCGIGAYMIMGGLAALLSGPGNGEDCPIENTVSVSAKRRFWHGVAAIACVFFGVILVVAGLLGFVGQGADGPPTP